MLIQSHIPGLLKLLPAVSSSLLQRRKASAFGLRVRGDVQVSMVWDAGQLIASVLVFNSPHPWLQGLHEDPQHPGFYTSVTTTATADAQQNAAQTLPLRLAVESPSRMKLMQVIDSKALPPKCIGVQNSVSETEMAARVAEDVKLRRTIRRERQQLIVPLTEEQIFPCSVTLCSAASADTASCYKAVGMIAEHAALQPQ